MKSSDALLTYQTLLHAIAIPRRDGSPDSEIPSALDLSGVDWPAFVAQSIRHGLAQVAAARLRDTSAPPEIIACLQRMVDGNAHRNTVMFTETACVTQTLEEAGIRCLVLKGVALALTVYDTHALRTFADIDLLVDSENLARATQVLEACGFEREGFDTDTPSMEFTYVCRVPEDILTATVAPEYLPALTPAVLARDAHLVKIDIHRGLGRFASGFMREIDMDVFWDRPRCVVFPDETTAQTLSYEATVVHLCMHARDHGFNRLIFPLDLSLVLRASAGSLDWDQVETIATRIGECECVWQLLDFISREFEASVPDSALDGLRRHVGAHAPTPLSVLDIFQTVEVDPRELFARKLASLSARETLVVLRQMLFPPKAYMREVHGATSPAAVAAAYLYRPFCLAGRLAVVAWRRWTAPRESAGVK